MPNVSYHIECEFENYYHKKIDRLLAKPCLIKCNSTCIPQLALPAVSLQV